MKTGIYIGSFNPIHNGHITIAKYLLDNNYLDKVEFIPSGNYWDKQDLLSLKDRINMIKLTINNEDNISINEECSGLDFTYQVREKLNQDNFYWIIGADNVINLDKWKKFEILKNDNFIVINRSNIDIEFYMKKHGINHYIVINDININISSTMIRNNIEDNKNMINSKVYEYIIENNLYGQNSNLYYSRMNGSMDNKKIILDYIKGKNILDVGPGGGVLLDLISNTFNDKKLFGIDNSTQVVNLLKDKYNVINGDAININKYFDDLDTIIFSSILHEIYSYTGFSKNNVITSISNAYKSLNNGGRIIIRDGIMSNDAIRIIEFKNIEDIKILDRYCNDFKGRKITYEKLSDNKVKMKINDAMEFLYTYTWGEKSYIREVQEQFGYFTLNEYVKIIKETLPNSKIIISKSFLQSGYEEHLLPKISIYDENNNVVKLPDSTCIIVIEKE